jgi:hypothetical protein
MKYVLALSGLASFGITIYFIHRYGFPIHPKEWIPVAIYGLGVCHTIRLISPSIYLLTQLHALACLGLSIYLMADRGLDWAFTRPTDWFSIIAFVLFWVFPLALVSEKGWIKRWICK